MPRSIKTFINLCAVNNFTFLLSFISEENLCSRDNGGCHHYCHYENRGVTCSCAAGFVLQADGKTCEGKKKYPCLFS